MAQSFQTDRQTNRQTDRVLEYYLSIEAYTLTQTCNYCCSLHTLRRWSSRTSASGRWSRTSSWPPCIDQSLVVPCTCARGLSKREVSLLHTDKFLRYMTGQCLSVLLWVIKCYVFQWCTCDIPQVYAFYRAIFSWFNGVFAKKGFLQIILDLMLT